MDKVPMALAGLLLIAATGPVQALDFKIKIPAYKGYDVSAETTMEIPGAVSTAAFRFDDGRIVVAGDKEGDIWSNDGGRTWAKGGVGPVSSKTALDIGDGEILLFYSTVSPREDGLHE